jgi:FMN-dependent NADH-azoreductase
VTTVLQVLVSPRRQSVSRLVAQQVIKRIADYHPDGCVVVRDLAADPPPHPGAELYEAILTGASDDDPRLAMSERMIAELESGDLVVVDTPMNNFTVPSTLKAWIDHVVRIRRAFRSSLQGKIGLLRNRPVIVVASHGGFAGMRLRDSRIFLRHICARFSERSGCVRYTFCGWKDCRGARRW